MLSINLSKFTSKENSGAYSIYSNSEKRQSNAPNKNLPSSYHWEKGTKMKNTCPKRAKFLLFFMFFVSICKFDTISCRRSRYVCLKLIIDWVRELSASTTVTTKQWLAKFALGPLSRCQSWELDSSFQGEGFRVWKIDKLAHRATLPTADVDTTLWITGRNRRQQVKNNQ